MQSNDILVPGVYDLYMNFASRRVQYAPALQSGPEMKQSKPGKGNTGRGRRCMTGNTWVTHLQKWTKPVISAQEASRRDLHDR